MVEFYLFMNSYVIITSHNLVVYSTDKSSHHHQIQIKSVRDGMIRVKMSSE